MRYLLSVAVVLSTAGVGLAAPEAGPPSPLPRPSHEVLLNGGMASAVGFIGLTYAYSPVDPIQMELGVGYGVTGVQLSAMPKINVGSRRHRFVGGIGVSTGVDQADALRSDGSRKVLVAYWLNAEAGYEFRPDEGITVLLAGGLTSALGGRTSHDDCIWECYTTDAERAEGFPLLAEDQGQIWLPQARVALGLSF